MRRNMNLIRLLLLEAEGENPPDLSEYDQRVLWQHRFWLIEAGLAVGAHSESVDGTIFAHELSRLTWDGCEYLDAIRDEGVWNKVQQMFKGFKTSFTFPLLKDAAIKIAMESAFG